MSACDQIPAIGVKADQCQDALAALRFLGGDQEHADAGTADKVHVGQVHDNAPGMFQEMRIQCLLNRSRAKGVEPSVEGHDEQAVFWGGDDVHNGGRLLFNN